MSINSYSTSKLLSEDQNESKKFFERAEITYKKENGFKSMFQKKAGFL